MMWMCCILLTFLTQIFAFELKTEPGPNHVFPYPIRKYIDSRQINPFECFETLPLFPKEIFEQCNFRVHWDRTKRIVFDAEKIEPEHVDHKIIRHDIKVSPMPCSINKCIFNKLKIIRLDGNIDRESFINLLDHVIEEHPMWNITRQPVIDECLDQNLIHNNGHCEINDILTCVFDVMSEHCPSKKSFEEDECQKPSSKRKEKPLICQINASRNRPSKRRELCPLPEFVSHELLQECNAKTFNHFLMTNEYAKEETTKKPFGIPKPGILRGYRPLCEPTRPATMCVIKKLNMTSKYGYLDYIKLRRAIVDLPFDSKDIVKAFDLIPYYKDHCSTEKKLLNVLDAIFKNAPPEQMVRKPSCYILHHQTMFDLHRPRLPLSNLPWRRENAGQVKKLPPFYLPHPFPPHQHPFMGEEPRYF